MNDYNMRETALDMFNMVLGRKLGEGTYRTVFEYLPDPTLVAKIENMTLYEQHNQRTFMNAQEFDIWQTFGYAEDMKKWLAPCQQLSPDGRILLQKRAHPVRPGELPKKVPSFLTDLKKDNFGIYEGRLVCVDYSTIIADCDTKLKTADWW